jgi:anti-sigma regulatory factor (Ser/Thr protein kinase)
LKLGAEAGILARAVTDADDRLLTAGEPLAAMQHGCGGELPGTIAIPSLLEVVRKSRRYQLKLARHISAQHVDESIGAWVEVEPREDGEDGCDIVLRSIRTSPLPVAAQADTEARNRDVLRHLAELTARLDARQCILTVESNASDLDELCQSMTEGQGKPWTNFLETAADSHRQPMHWRLLDGVRLSAPGSARSWCAHLIPQIPQGAQDPSGFELLLVSDRPAPSDSRDKAVQTAPAPQALIVEGIGPVLRQPIERIRANAETIRTRLAGPLPENYTEYATEIVSAAEHLLGLLDDLSDLEALEAEGFSTAPDQIDLAEVARQAAGILSVRAQDRKIRIDAPQAGVELPATAEFRRVLQILLNLLGNAINYSPEESSVWIRVDDTAGRARVTVADQGPGLAEEYTEAVFKKFERLGRSGDGGSGLGLYISRKLARAMGGELSVESAPGQGARFVLELPGPDQA